MKAPPVKTGLTTRSVPDEPRCEWGIWRMHAVMADCPVNAKDAEWRGPGCTAGLAAAGIRREVDDPTRKTRRRI
ncbi:hypothetical protein GCM10027285_09850 [Oleiagrimonas citrea]